MRGRILIMLQSVLWIAGIVVLSVAVSIVRGIVDGRTDRLRRSVFSEQDPGIYSEQDTETREK